jgi:hypothetical protein
MNFVRRLSFLFLLSSFLFSCAPTNRESTPQVVDVYATASASPWLDGLYACAADASIVLNVTADAPQITLCLGQPDEWAGSVFQVGTEEIVVVANLQSPLPALTLEQARTIFAGQGNPSTQVWGYASAEDTQKVFEQAVMNGRSVTSFARLAVSPLNMVESLSADGNAVGLLPRRWMTDQLRELFVAASVPVLALTPSEPAGSVRDLIACMQKDD